MPVYEEGDVVYALKRISESPSGDSPGGLLCNWGDKLIVKSYGKHDPKVIFVHHEHITDGRSFYVHGFEISSMKHFSHNKPVDNAMLISDWPHRF